MNDRTPFSVVVVSRTRNEDGHEKALIVDAKQERERVGDRV